MGGVYKARDSRLGRHVAIKTELLRDGEKERCDCQIWLRSEHWMDDLRKDPNYNRFIHNIGYPGK